MLSNVLKIFQNLRLGVLINRVLIKKKRVYHIELEKGKQLKPSTSKLVDLFWSYNTLKTRDKIERSFFHPFLPLIFHISYLNQHNF